MTATSTITVLVPTLTSIAVAPATSTLAVGGTQAPVITGRYSVNSLAVRTSGVTFASLQLSVATVTTAGLVTAVAAGSSTITATASSRTATAAITATLGALAVAGSSPVTVTAPLALPTTIAPTPTVAAADVISLFSSAYTNRAVETWRTSWSAGSNELVDPYVIAGHDVKRYSLFNFVGVEFGVATPANAIDASTYTTFHVDVWTPNPSGNLEIQLVNNATGTAAIGKYQAGALATGSWISLDIPLSSFAGLTSRNQLQQLLFVSAAPTVPYVDNIYFRK